MGKLHAVNALVSGKKSETEKQVSEIYKIVQKENLFDGLHRSYRPNDEENGEKLPPETQRIQHTCKSLISQARERWTELWDLVATQDEGNTGARADVVVDGKAVLHQVPVTTLLFLDKQVNDLESFVSKLPTPDPSEEWEFNDKIGFLSTKPAKTQRTKKVVDYKVIVPATKEHPAQVAQVAEDVITGYWEKILYTGRVTAKEKATWLAKLRQLKDAIKVARETANLAEVKPARVANPLFEFVFGASSPQA